MVDPGSLPAQFPAHFTERLAAVYGLSWVTLGVIMLLPGMVSTKNEPQLVDDR